MSKEKKKASIVITITAEDGQKVELKYTGSNEYIAVVLGEFGILGEEEIRGTRKVLSAAALTYVASAAAAILQLLRLVILFGGRRRDD